MDCQNLRGLSSAGIKMIFGCGLHFPHQRFLTAKTSEVFTGQQATPHHPSDRLATRARQSIKTSEVCRVCHPFIRCLSVVQPQNLRGLPRHHAARVFDASFTLIMYSYELSPELPAKKTNFVSDSYITFAINCFLK